MGYFELKDAIRCEKTQEYLAITEGPKTAPVTVEYPLATLMVSLTRGEAGSPDNSFFTPKLAGSEGTCKDHHHQFHSSCEVFVIISGLPTTSIGLQFFTPHHIHHSKEVLLNEQCSCSWLVHLLKSGHGEPAGLHSSSIDLPSSSSTSHRLVPCTSFVLSHLVME